MTREGAQWVCRTEATADPLRVLPARLRPGVREPQPSIAGPARRLSQARGSCHELLLRTVSGAGLGSVELPLLQHKRENVLGL